MKRLPYTPFIPPPTILADDAVPPVTIATLSVRELCAIAGISNRVTSPHTPSVLLHQGSRHFVGRSLYYVGLDGFAFSRDQRHALRVLEILAHGFHDYAARENICGRGLFGVPRRLGRPALGGRSMSPAERMRRMRKRRR